MISYKSGGQHGGLDRWFAEKWVDIKTGEPCGRQEGEKRDGYPACRPSKRISSDTPKTASELSSAERQKFKQEKTSSQRISYNHNRKEYGGENINLEMMKSGGNVPTNPSLWSRAKAAAKSKYDVYPSAYANGFAAKWYKSHGGGWRKAEYGMEVMGNGGVPTNPGFVALPEYVQQNIINNMAIGGQKMPPQLAYARFAAAGNLNQLSRYGYQDGGEEDVYWRTKKPMVNDPSMDAISKVLLQRNQDKNFMQRAAGFGNQNGIPTRYIDGQDPDSNNMSNLLMGFGDNYVSPTIIETFPNFLGNDSTMLRTAPGQLSYQPNQIQEYIKTPTVDIADYFATKGYKRAANDMYGMQYQDGGGKVPNDFNEFQEFNKTLPDNLRDDNFKYGDYSHYDLYGMWDASGKPKSFDDVKDTEIFPLQEDGYYHGFSVGNDGILLKPKSHPSAFMEFMINQLNPESYYNGHIIQREDGRLQYVPYKKKQGGSVTLNTGGENHRIYIKTTNRGEGEKGHIMVNHPTMDKGMWDTIDLTKKSGATTIAQGVAATKKWHRENPYMKQKGGSVNLNLPVISHSEKEPFVFNKFLVNDRNNNLFVAGVNPIYQNKNFSVGPYMIGVGNKYFQKFPVDYGVRGNYNVNDKFNINMDVGKNKMNVGMRYNFKNGGNIPMFQPGGEETKWYYPKEVITNERPYYYPPTETLYLNPDYNNEPEVVRQHELFHHLQKINGGAQRPEYYPGPLKEPNMMMNKDLQGAYWNRKTVDVNNLMDQVIKRNPDFQFYPEDLFYNKVIDGLEYDTPGTLENEAQQYEDYIRNGGKPMFTNGGGIPERYRNMGFTNVGAKRQSTRPGKKWMVLAKKGDQYKVVHGGYKGMQDFKQHHSEQRKENFWSRMGGRNSSKATDPFSPLYWHKRFGTWEQGGEIPKAQDGVVVNKYKQQVPYIDYFPGAIDYDDYYNKSKKYLSRDVFKGSSLKAQDITNAASKFHSQTGYKYPLELLLSQAQTETLLGANLKSKNNFFNVGNTDKGAIKNYETPESAILDYMNLMYKDYLQSGKKDYKDLLKQKSFINYQGNRYASNPNYENEVLNQSQFINKFVNTKKKGGQYMAIGGQNVMNPIVKKDNRNWLEYLKN